MQCVSVLYPNDPGCRFDFDYYLKNHMALVQRAYGAAVARCEVHKGLPGADGTPPRFVCVCNIYIADMQAFGAAAAKHQGEVVADIAKFTNVMPVVQFDEVL